MKGKPTRRAATLLAGAVALAIAGLALWLTGLDRLPRLPLRRPDFAPGRPTRAAAARALAPRDLAPVARAVQRLRAAQGGELALPSEQGRLVVPPGALPRDTTVTATEFRAADAADVVIDLAPDGLALSTPARLELATPPGFSAAETEIVVYDNARGDWQRAPDQGPGSDDGHVAALIEHFSLRRVRIRPGLDFPGDPRRARGTLFLESDASNSFEKLIAGRWRAVNRRSPAYRELIKLGRLGRRDLIASGRLRAVTAAPESIVLNNDLRTVELPADAPAARTGWARLTRLDASGRPTRFATVARVARSGSATGVGVVRLSRAALEALGLSWGVDFGVSAGASERAWVRLDPANGAPALSYVPIQIEPWTPGSLERR